MINSKRTILAAILATFLSFGAFAQKNEDRRPPKDNNTKAVVTPKEKPPQNSNSNQDKKDKDKKGRP
jgi:hypothetical protein